jgi:hypothetical protein
VLIEIAVDRQANVEIHRRLSEAATEAIDRIASEKEEASP